MFEPIFEPGEIANAFLRAVDTRGAAWAEEGVVDVAGDNQLEGGEGGRFFDRIGFQEGGEGRVEGLAPFLEGIS